MTPKEFIDENYFSLTIDCKREISEIYQALEDYTKTKQLTLTDVVSTYHCESYDFKRQGRRCAKQCDSCEWMEKKQ